MAAYLSPPPPVDMTLAMGIQGPRSSRGPSSSSPLAGSLGLGVPPMRGVSQPHDSASVGGFPGSRPLMDCLPASPPWGAQTLTDTLSGADSRPKIMQVWFHLLLPPFWVPSLPLEPLLPPMLWAYWSPHWAPPPQAELSGSSTRGMLDFLESFLGQTFPLAVSPLPQLHQPDPDNNIVPLPRPPASRGGFRCTSDPSISGQSRKFTPTSVVVQKLPHGGWHPPKAFESNPSSSAQCSEDGYHGGCLLSSSSTGRSAPASSPTSTFHHGTGSNSSDYNASDQGASSADDLSSFTPSAPSAPDLSPDPEGSTPSLSPVPVSATPIPLPEDQFTLPSINSSDNYLCSHNLILFWPCSPGFSMACNDSELIADTHNTLVSQYWEGQLCTSLKGGSVWFLFENTGSTFYSKGFEMLQLLEDNFCPSFISNTLTTLLTLFNTTQGDKEGLHEFRAQFEGHMSALSHSLVAIPHILQVMLFLCALHSRYQDLLTQFLSKQKDLSSARIDSVVADAWFMDDFIVVGAKNKSIPQGASPRTPAAATAVTDKRAKSIALPGRGLLQWNQLQLSPDGINLSRVAFIVPSATRKKNIVLKNAHF
jgi:hypothetical protein